MKRLIILLTIALGTTTMASAQHCDKQCDKHKGQPTEWAVKKTNDMVVLYNLNEKQAAQLLELNKEYSDKLKPIRRRDHQGHAGLHKPGPKKQMSRTDAKDCCKDGKAEAQHCDKAAKADAKDCCKDAKAEARHCDKAAKADAKDCCKDAKTEAQHCDKAAKAAAKDCCKDAKPAKAKPAKVRAAISPEQVKQYKAEYDAKVKKIMTSKQYKQYQKMQK